MTTPYWQSNWLQTNTICTQLIYIFSKRNQLLVITIQKVGFLITIPVQTAAAPPPFLQCNVSDRCPPKKVRNRCKSMKGFYFSFKLALRTIYFITTNSTNLISNIYSTDRSNSFQQFIFCSVQWCTQIHNSDSAPLNSYETFG